MKDKILWILILLAVVVLALLLYINQERNYKDYFKLPYYSFKEDNCKEQIISYFDDNNEKREKNKSICIDTVEFVSYKNINKVKKQVDKEILSYKKMLCNNSLDVYYNKDKDLSVIKYDINRDGMKTKYYIKYFKGNLNTGDCMIISNPNNIEFGYDKSKNKDNKYKLTDKQYKYLASDGKYYDVHSDCPLCLTIKNGNGKDTSFKSMLESNYIDMNTVINSLNSDKAKIKTKKYDYKYGTLYSNDVFSLLQCTKNKKDIYISKFISYDKKLCK